MGRGKKLVQQQFSWRVDEGDFMVPERDKNTLVHKISNKFTTKIKNSTTNQARQISAWQSAVKSFPMISSKCKHSAVDDPTHPCDTDSLTSFEQLTYFGLLYFSLTACWAC